MIIITADSIKIPSNKTTEHGQNVIFYILVYNLPRHLQSNNFHGSLIKPSATRLCLCTHFPSLVVHLLYSYTIYKIREKQKN